MNYKLIKIKKVKEINLQSKKVIMQIMKMKSPSNKIAQSKKFPQ